MEGHPLHRWESRLQDRQGGRLRMRVGKSRAGLQGCRTGAGAGGVGR